MFEVGEERGNSLFWEKWDDFKDHWILVQEKIWNRRKSFRFYSSIGIARVRSHRRRNRVTIHLWLKRDLLPNNSFDIENQFCQKSGLSYCYFILNGSWPDKIAVPRLEGKLKRLWTIEFLQIGKVITRTSQTTFSLVRSLLLGLTIHSAISSGQVYVQLANLILLTGRIVTSWLKQATNPFLPIFHYLRIPYTSFEMQKSSILFDSRVLSFNQVLYICINYLSVIICFMNDNKDSDRPSDNATVSDRMFYFRDKAETEIKYWIRNANYINVAYNRLSNGKWFMKSIFVCV